jgi:hypothetical protein
MSDLYEVKHNPRIIEIPKNATNGDVIKALFPNVSVCEHNGGATYSVNNEYKFNATWWNAPYKSEGSNEIHCKFIDEEIAKSFIEDVEAVKDLLPKAEGGGKE